MLRASASTGGGAPLNLANEFGWPTLCGFGKGWALLLVPTSDQSAAARLLTRNSTNYSTASLAGVAPSPLP